MVSLVITPHVWGGGQNTHGCHLSIGMQKKNGMPLLNMHSHTPPKTDIGVSLHMGVD